MTSPKLKLVDGVATEGQFDPFSFEDRGYSVDGFYTRSTGPNKEPGETKYLKISPTILGAISKVIYSRDFPSYRTDADFIRDALVHRLKYINTLLQDGGIEKQLGTHVKLSRIEARALEMAEMEQMLNLHEETMRTAVESGDTEFLRELLDDAESDVEDLRLIHQNRLRQIIEKYQDHYDRLSKR